MKPTLRPGPKPSLFVAAIVFALSALPGFAETSTADAERAMLETLANAGFGSGLTPEAAKEQADGMKRRFDALDLVQQQANIPPLPELPKATPVAEAAPAGSSYYKQAFVMADGCKFFSINADGDLAIGALWKGAPCNGGLIAGHGTLAVVVRNRAADGKTTFVHKTYEGNFVDGFLHGAGLKQNYPYDTARQPVGEYYRQEGQFKYGLLDGEGHKFEVFPKGKQPSATSLEGKFVAGTPVGHLFRVRNTPEANVIADQYELIYNDKGQTLRFPTFANNKQPLPGRIRFAGKGGEWSVDLVAFDQDTVESGTLRKVTIGKRGSTDMFAASCNDWIHAENGDWQCNKGTFFEGHSFDVTYSLPSGPFAFNPQAPQRWQYDTSQQIVVGIGSHIDEKTSLMLCNADRTQCKGKTKIPVSLCTDYRGPAEIRQGALVPVGGPGEFYRTCKKDKKDKKEIWLEGVNELAARCDSFDSPLRCGRGKIFGSDGSEYAGAFVLDNLRIGTDENAPQSMATYQFIKEFVPMAFKRDGWGVITFANHRWAKARYVSGEIVEVGDCGAPDLDVKYCELRDKTVTFVY